MKKLIRPGSPINMPAAKSYTFPFVNLHFLHTLMETTILIPTIWHQLYPIYPLNTYIIMRAYLFLHFILNFKFQKERSTQGT